jgi:hypothetical protein
MTLRHALCTLGFGLCLLTGIVVAQGPPPLPPPLPPPPPPSPNQPRDGSATQKTGTAKLVGRVTSLDTGRPLRRALVRAVGPELRDGKSVSTDAEGRWELREIPAGRLTISVSKGGYVGLSYGQRRPFEAGKTVDVANGATVDKLDVALPRGGAVTGRVVDEFGEPVTGVSVSALRFRYLNGQRQLAPTGTADTTDDLGNYRLHGLPPGDYYVSARSNAFTFLGNSEDRSGYGQSFYPGTSNVNEAQRLQVAVGQEAQNIMISLVPSKISNISGTITSASGKPVRQGMVMMRENGPIAMTSIRPGIIENGAWKISGVAPGDYLLVAQVMDMDAIGATGTTVGMPTPEIATTSVTVTGEDISGVAMTTTLGGTARGVIRFDGGAPPPTPSSTTTLVAVDQDSSAMARTTSAVVKPDWTFELKGLTGRRLLRAINLPAGWTLKSVLVDGTDVIDTGLEVKSGQEESDVQVVLTNRKTEISGTVQDAKGNADDFVVLVFSSDPQHWGWQSRHVRLARPDQTGRFLVDGLPAGSYLAVALEYLEPGEETNPDFLERVKSLATSVRLTEGEKKPITLKLSGQ